MSNNKQSSVDKLWDDVKGWIPQGQYAGVREYYLEAKAMHKEEHYNTFYESRLTHPMIGFKHETFEEHYNKTFNNNEQ